MDRSPFGCAGVPAPPNHVALHHFWNRNRIAKANDVTDYLKDRLTAACEIFVAALTLVLYAATRPLWLMRGMR